MFMVAGNLLCFGGHGYITDLSRVVQSLPLTVAAFVLAGVSIMGLPPSGGFIGKWLLLETALEQERWDMVVIIMLGGLLAAGYIFKVLRYAFVQADEPPDLQVVPPQMEWTALLLACAAILLGFLASPVLSLLIIGDPFAISEVKL